MCLLLLFLVLFVKRRAAASGARPSTTTALSSPSPSARCALSSSCFLLRFYYFFTLGCFLIWLRLLVYASASPYCVCEEKSFWHQLLFSRTSIDYYAAVFALSVG